jgi:hypothetical protein
MALTYREQAELIARMTEEQKDQNVTVYVSGVGEFYTLVSDYPFIQAQADDVLDVGHYYLVI